MTAWWGSGEGTLTDSPCRADLAESWCGHRSRWALSLKETAWALGSRRGPLPHVPRTAGDKEAETSTLQCSLFYARGLGFLVFLR